MIVVTHWILHSNSDGILNPSPILASSNILNPPLIFDDNSRSGLLYLVLKVSNLKFHDILKVKPLADNIPILVRFVILIVVLDSSSLILMPIIKLAILLTRVMIVLLNNIFIFKAEYIRILTLLLKDGRIYLFKFIFDDRFPYPLTVVID